MIVVVLFIALGVPVTCAALAALRLFQAVSAVLRVVQRPATPLRKLRAGPVEVAGFLHARGEPVIGVSGVPCAALEVRAVGTVTRRGRTRYGTAVRVARVASCTLEDESGAKLRLARDTNVSLQGEGFVSHDIPVGDLPEEWRDELLRGSKEFATHLIVEEYRIEDGAWVTVHGIAEVKDSEGEPHPDARATRLVSPKREPMLILLGEEREATKRALALCGGMAVAVALLVDIAVQAVRAALGLGPARK